MKKLIAILAASVLLPAAATAADGTFTFNTDDGLADGPFVFDTDTTTKLDNTFKGQIYAGASNSEGALSAVGPVAQFGLFNGNPLAAANGIIFNGTEVSVSGVNAGGAGFYQLRAWQGTFASYEAAVAGSGNVGKSAVTALTFGGDTGSGVIPGPNVDGFASFSLVPVPEPTTMALGLMGLGGLIAARRRKNA